MNLLSFFTTLDVYRTLIYGNGEAREKMSGYSKNIDLDAFVNEVQIGHESFQNRSCIDKRNKYN